jgi:signal transduction histidine kinase
VETVWRPVAGGTVSAFWRGHAATTAPGSGIGLAVVAELVAAHHGTLDVANRAEGGAEFTITLPSNQDDKANRS